MADEAFLNAILATPGDDTPRLVYADWLDEQGESARAEFIRVQIEQAQRPRPDLEERSRQLLDEHRTKWIIPDLRGVQEFHRGFVDSLQILAEEFVANAERIGRLAPVTNLRLPVAVEHLPALAAVPWLSRVTHLDLTGNVGLGSRLDEFFGNVEMTNLRSLELRNCQLWPDGLSAFGRLAVRLPQLERLNLSGNPMSDDGVARIVDAPALSKLKELILRCDELQEIDAIHADGATSLANASLESLLHLDLAGHYVGDLGLFGFITSRRVFPFEVLDLSYNEIGADPRYLLQMLRSDCFLHLKKLTLDGNRLDQQVVNEIADWRQLETMNALSVLDCNLSSEAIARLADSPWKEKFIHEEARMYA